MARVRGRLLLASSPLLGLGVGLGLALGVGVRLRLRVGVGARARVTPRAHLVESAGERNVDDRVRVLVVQPTHLDGLKQERARLRDGWG